MTAWPRGGSWRARGEGAGHSWAKRLKMAPTATPSHDGVGPDTGAARSHERASRWPGTAHLPSATGAFFTAMMPP